MLRNLMMIHHSMVLSKHTIDTDSGVTTHDCISGPKNTTQPSTM